MKSTILSSVGIYLISLLLFSCSGGENKNVQKVEVVKDEKKDVKTERIISLKGSFSEIVATFNLTDKIVGTDITSTFPKEVATLPKLGHNRNISVEGILALNPSIIIVDPNEMKKESLEQLQSSQVKIISIEQTYSPEGTKEMIQKLATELNVDAAVVTKLNQKLDDDIAQVQSLEHKPKVLFIYARGAGTLMVAGENTQMQSMIELAGGENAVSGFESFKPLTNEALVSANPDVILMFSRGKQSLNGEEGVLAIPGMSETTAGKNKNIIAMDGQYISGFGPRLGEAAIELNKELAKIVQSHQNAQ
ncbi:MAG: ABC transporter substrate-binding protein [Cytophagales bacterium]|nr:ABC transporter substrate-binding protein [Cytophagales bacterium]